MLPISVLINFLVKFGTKSSIPVQDNIGNNISRFTGSLQVMDRWKIITNFILNICTTNGKPDIKKPSTKRKEKCGN